MLPPLWLSITAWLTNRPALSVIAPWLVSVAPVWFSEVAAGHGNRAVVVCGGVVVVISQGQADFSVVRDLIPVVESAGRQANHAASRIARRALVDVCSVAQGYLAVVHNRAAGLVLEVARRKGDGAAGLVVGRGLVDVPAVAQRDGTLVGQRAAGLVLEVACRKGDGAAGLVVGRGLVDVLAVLSVIAPWLVSVPPAWF